MTHFIPLEQWRTPNRDGYSGDPVHDITYFMIAHGPDGLTFMSVKKYFSKEFVNGGEQLPELVVRLHDELIHRGIRTVNARIDPNNPQGVLLDFSGYERLDHVIACIKGEYECQRRRGYTLERVKKIFSDAINQSQRVNKSFPEILTEDDKKLLHEYELFCSLMRATELPADATVLNFRDIISAEQIEDAEKNHCAYRVMRCLGITDKRFKENYTKYIGSEYDKAFATFGAWGIDFTPENIIVDRSKKRRYLRDRSKKQQPFSVVIPAPKELKNSNSPSYNCLYEIVKLVYSQRENRLPNRRSNKDNVYIIDLIPKKSSGLVRDIFLIYHPSFPFDEATKQEFLEQIAKNYCTQLNFNYENVKEGYQRAVLLALNITGLTKATNSLDSLEDEIKRNEYIDNAPELLKDSEFYFALVKQSYDQLAKQQPENRAEILRLKKTVEKAYARRFEETKELCIEHGLLPGYGCCSQEGAWGVFRESVRESVTKYKKNCRCIIKTISALNGLIAGKKDISQTINDVRAMWSRPQEERYVPHYKYETYGSLFINYLKTCLNRICGLKPLCPEPARINQKSDC